MTDDPLAQLRATEGEKDRDWISLQFVLGHLEPKTQEAVFAAAVPHWFDFEILSALVGKSFNLTKKAFKALTSLSFVEAFPERGYNIHESTRALILRRLSTNAPELLTKYSKEAAAYFHSKQKLADPWLIEAIYHSTVAGDLSYSSLMYYGHNFQNKYKYGQTETLCRTLLEGSHFLKLPKDILAVCHYLLGSTYVYFGKTRPAKLAARTALSFKVKDNYFNALCWWKLAEIEYALDERKLAIRHLNRALLLLNQVGDDNAKGDCLLSMGYVLLVEGEYKKAISSAKSALRLFKKIQILGGVANCYCFLGLAALGQKRLKLAADRYNKALEYSKEAHETAISIAASIGLAEVELKRGNFASARKLLKRSLRRAEQINFASYYAKAVLVEAALEYALGRYDESKSKALKAARLFEQMEDHHQESDAWLVLVNVYKAKNELEKALDCSVKAQRLFEIANKKSATFFTNQISELKTALRLKKKTK